MLYIVGIRGLMTSQNPASNSQPDEAKWPIGEMLVTGTFATRTDEEKRYKQRYRIVCIIMWSWIVLAYAYHSHPFPAMRLLTLLLPAPLFTYLAWMKRKYFLTLDELTRRIELEGMAWAYSLGVIAALWAGGITYAVSLKWTFDPRLISWMPFFLFAMFLATVKGTYRYFATRRY
jgi:hypothetical protein